MSHRRRSSSPRRRSGSGRHPGPPPAGLGQAVVTIDAVGGQGDGIARHGGVPVFVPQTASGDIVRVELRPRPGGGLDGAPRELLAAGPGRQDPPCPHAGACGGCVVQHLADPAYADWKRGLAVDALAKAGITADRIDPLVRIPPQSRRRIGLRARKTTRGGTPVVVLGYTEPRSHRIVDVATCSVAHPHLVGLLPALRALLCDRLVEGEAATLALTRLSDGIDLVLDMPRPPGLDDRMMLSDWADANDLARLSWRSAGTAPEPIAHRRAGTVLFDGIPVRVPPGGFLQATEHSEAAIRAAVTAGLAGAGGAIADLFAGIGAFALPLARSHPVLGIDSHPEAIDCLLSAARGAGFGERVQGEVRNLFDRPLEAGELDGLAAVVFDPPRAGARAQAAALAKAGPPRVVAVSCRPASFARDARILVDAGYRLTRMTPIDQFVWSAHLELVAVFER